MEYLTIIFAILYGIVMIGAILSRKHFNYIHLYLLLSFFYTFTVPLYKIYDGFSIDIIDFNILIFKLLCHFAFFTGIFIAFAVAKNYMKLPQLGTFKLSNSHVLLSGIFFFIFYYLGIYLAFGGYNEYLSLFRADRMNVDAPIYFKFLMGLRNIVVVALTILFWLKWRSKALLMLLLFIFGVFLIEGNRNPLFFSAIFAVGLYEYYIKKISNYKLVVVAAVLLTVMMSFKVFYYYVLFYRYDYSVMEYFEKTAFGGNSQFRLDRSEFIASYTNERIIFRNPDMLNASYLENSILLLLPKSLVSRENALENKMAEEIDPEAAAKNIRFAYSGPGEAFNNFHFAGFFIYFIFGFFICLMLALPFEPYFKILLYVVIIHLMFNLMRSSFGASLKEMVFLTYSLLLWLFISFIISAVKKGYRKMAILVD